MPAERTVGLARTAVRLITLGVATLSLAVGTAAAATGTSGTPTLGSLPQLIAQASGQSTLALDFTHTPDESTLRAGIAAASAFSGLSNRGVTIVTVIGATRRQILHAPVSVLEVDARPGPSRLTLRHLTGGRLLLTLAGEGQALVDTARVLSTSYLSAFSSTQTTLPQTLTQNIARLDSAHRGSEAVAGGSVTGTGTLSLTRQIAIPIDKVIDHNQATLQLGVEYDAPGGGRLTLKLNGQTLAAYQSRGVGNTVVYRFHIASVWTDGSDLLPGYYLQPGQNKLTITAQPEHRALAAQVGTQLGLAPHSALEMKLTERRPLTQIGVWPFPVFNGSWADTTVVTPAPSSLSQRALSALVTALANTERLTGVAADPHITYSRPTAAQRQGNLLVFGNPETVAGITPNSPLVPGLVTEQRLKRGGYALLITDTQAMSAFGSTYAPGQVTGRTAVISPSGTSHTLVVGPQVAVFAKPRIVWLKPAAGLAAMVLVWVAVRVFLARRRLRTRTPMPSGGVVS